MLMMFYAKVNEILSEFLECFQKTENKMEICRVCCQFEGQFCENSLKFPKPNKLFIVQVGFSIHSFIPTADGLAPTSSKNANPPQIAQTNMRL